MPDLTSALAGIREQLGKDDAFFSCACGRGDYSLCRKCPYNHCSVHGVEARLLAAVDAVLARHVPKTVTERRVCTVHSRGGRGLGMLTLLKYRDEIDACPDCLKVDLTVCAGCDPVCADDDQWPCDDVRAISRALLGEESPGG